MHLTYRNVNAAFQGLVHGFANRREHSRQWPGTNAAPVFPIVEQPSRNGPVLMIPEPVIITYKHPRERVLFNQARDANPFFHLYESLWMLAGRNDVSPLAYYASNVVNYSDDGKTFNGAYGYRWRKAMTAERRLAIKRQGEGLCSWQPIDQIECLIDHLTRIPESRRAVLQMWNVEDDLLRIGSDLGIMQGKLSKDVCCNLSVMFSLRETTEKRHDGLGLRDCFVKYLDMTVTNRSNDLIWGMLGANVVHFSVLQEYMAAHLGVEVGVYNQFTNNLHVYTENGSWKPEEFLAEYNKEPESLLDYEREPVGWEPFPLVKDSSVFDKEVVEFVEFHKTKDMDLEHNWRDANLDSWREPFLRHVANPMMMAFHCHKDREYEDAKQWCTLIKADDWRAVAICWLEKRETNWRAKQK